MTPGRPVTGRRFQRVLVVDALAGDRQVLADRLRMTFGAGVAEAADAYTAFRLTQNRADWDALVIALDQPGLNGFELFFQIEAACGRPLAVVFISASPGPRRVQLGEGRLAQILPKPVDPALLAASLEEGRLVLPQT